MKLNASTTIVNAMGLLVSCFYLFDVSMQPADCDDTKDQGSQEECGIE